MKYFFLLVLLSLPGISSATEFYVTPSTINPSVGEVVEVELFTNTTPHINAVSGELVFNPTQLEVENIIYRGSRVSFWVERPQDSTPGIINFSGITPGGFTGPANSLFIVRFLPLVSGTTTVSGLSLRALLHDGLGTDTRTTMRPATLLVQSAKSEPTITPIKDDTPPENFTPVVIPHPNDENAQVVLVFSATDKDSGIAAYYVREYKTVFGRIFSRWRKAESPYFLQDQSLQSYIEVKAVDLSNNKRTVNLYPTYPDNTKIWWLWLGLLLLLTIFFWYKKRNAN